MQNVQQLLVAGLKFEEFALTMAYVLSRGIRITTIVIGFILLLLAAGAIACGAVEMTKLENHGATSIGLWAIYFLIPGVLCLAAGFGSFTAFAVALGAHIVGILVALAGFVYSSVVWSVLNTCTARFGEGCLCVRNSVSYNFDISCSDLETIRDVNAGLTIIYVVLFISSFVGSILGCAGACCCPKVQKRHTIRARHYDLPGYSESMEMSRHREKHFYPYSEESRYAPEGRYVQERVYNHRGPFVQFDKPSIEEMRYVKEKPYMEERRYIEERPYREDRRYTEERRRREELAYFEGGRYNDAYAQPSYLAFRKEAPGERGMFAGHTNYEAAEDTLK